MKLFIVPSMAAAVLMGAAAIALAQMPTDPAAQVDYRQDHMEKLLGAARQLNAFARDGQGTVAEMADPAGRVAEVAAVIDTLFPEGTAVGVGDSNALAEIWANPDDFTAKRQGLKDASAGLSAAVATGDEAAVKAAIATLGDACSACHSTYRKD